MATHLLPCTCGESIPVEPRQAGETVICGCGAKLEVPSWSKVQALPLAEQAAPVGGDRSGWGFRQGVLTAGLLAFLVLAAIGAQFWVSEPPPPGDFDGELRSQLIAQNVEEWTPRIGWELWRREYRPITVRGRLDPFENPQEEATRQQITMHRLYRWTFLGLAALVGVGTVVAAMSSGPSPRR